MNRVYIADDEIMIRRLLKKAFDYAGFSTSTFATGRELIEALDGLEPGVIILDIRMAGMSGLEVLEEMAGRTRIHAVLMLTSSYDVATAVRAVRAGAIDFIEKPASISELVTRVRDLGEMVAKWKDQRGALGEAQSQMSKLTKREIEVGMLLASGLSNKDIGKRLDLSSRTVEAHRARIISKLGLKSSYEVVRIFTVYIMNLRYFNKKKDIYDDFYSSVKFNSNISELD